MQQAKGTAAEYGWCVQMVLPGSGPGDEVPYAYTAGLFALSGQPEIGVWGLVPPLSKTILDDLAAKARDGLDLVPGMRVPEVLQGFDVLLRGPVHSRKAEMFLATLVADRPHGTVPALQVLWPDLAGVFPGEPGCSLSGRAQPLQALV